MDDFKLCCRCGVPLPLDRFRLLPKTGKRASWCRPCGAKYMRQYRHAKRLRKVRQFVSKSRQTNTAQTMSGLVAGVAQKLGGVSRFCDLWASHLKTASPSAFLRSVNLLMRMACLIDEENRKEPAKERKRAVIFNRLLSVAHDLPIGNGAVQPAADGYGDGDFGMSSFDAR